MGGLSESCSLLGSATVNMAHNAEGTPPPPCTSDYGIMVIILGSSYIPSILLLQDAPMSLLKGTQKEALSMYNIRKVPSERQGL